MVKKILLAGLFISFSSASLGYTPPKELEIQDNDIRKHFIFMNTVQYCNFGKVMSNSQMNKVLTPLQDKIMDLVDYKSLGANNLGKMRDYLYSDHGKKDRDYGRYVATKYVSNGYLGDDKLFLDGVIYPPTQENCKIMKDLYSKMEKQVGEYK